MYLARFEAEAGEWLQGVAAMPVTPPPESRPGWWSELESVVRDATLVDGMSVSRRVSLGGDGLLRQLVMVLARSEHEPEIRRLLAGEERFSYECDWFKLINARGTTVIVATHDPQVVKQIHRRAVTLVDGVLTEEHRSAERVEA